MVLRLGKEGLRDRQEAAERNVGGREGPSSCRLHIVNEGLQKPNC